MFNGLKSGVCVRVCVTQVLLPTLTSGNIVLMNNLGSNKSKPVRTAIRHAGAKRRFPPSYCCSN